MANFIEQVHAAGLDDKLEQLFSTFLIDGSPSNREMFRTTLATYGHSSFEVMNLIASGMKSNPPTVRPSMYANLYTLANEIQAKLGVAAAPVTQPVPVPPPVTVAQPVVPVAPPVMAAPPPMPAPVAPPVQVAPVPAPVVVQPVAQPPVAVAPPVQTPAQEAAPGNGGEKKRRTRRTKAQIEADRKAEEANKNFTVPPVDVASLIPPTPQVQPEPVQGAITQAAVTEPMIDLASKASYKFLILRTREDVLAGIDEVWKQQGMASRSQFFKQAIQNYLLSIGKPEISAKLE